MAVLGLPGVKRDGIRVGRGLRDTRCPPGCSEQRSEAWDGMRGGGGGRTRRSIAGARRSGLGKDLLVMAASSKGGEGGTEAHRGLVVAGAAAQGGRRRGWAAAQAELGDGDDAAALRAPGTRDLVHTGPVKVFQGSKGPGLRRRREIMAADRTTWCGGSGAIPVM